MLIQILLRQIEKHYPEWLEEKQQEYANDLSQTNNFLCDECGAEYVPEFSYGDLDICAKCDRKALKEGMEKWDTLKQEAR